MFKEGSTTQRCEWREVVGRVDRLVGTQSKELIIRRELITQVGSQLLGRTTRAFSQSSPKLLTNLLFYVHV